MKAEVRIDKWLWAVRLYKTRTLATEACKKGKIIINKIQVKPSRTIKIGEIVDIKKNPYILSFKVIGLAENRMNAKLVENFIENVTSKEQLELIEEAKIVGNLGREKGSGRPTKKERREIDSLQNEDFEDEWEFEF